MLVTFILFFFLLLADQRKYTQETIFSLRNICVFCLQMEENIYTLNICCRPFPCIVPSIVNDMLS